MIRFKNDMFYYSKIVLIGSFLALLITLFFFKPRDINEYYEKTVAFSKKGDVKKLDPRRKIEDYNLKVAKSGIFNFISYNEVSSKTLEEESLDRFSFNGIIVLDKKHLAIYDNKEKQQHLVKEGESLSGITVKEIKEGSAIIEMNDERMEISF